MQPTLRIEREVIRQVGIDGKRRPYEIKAAAGLKPGNPMYRGILLRLEQRNMITFDGTQWRLLDAGRRALSGVQAAKIEMA